jgi:integrative and conjugative element protein (TIGR02256 family)
MTSRLFFRPDGRQYALFTGPVLRSMYAHTQRKTWQKEAGGEIFAPDTEGPGIIITAVAGPNPGDRRSRNSYVPDVKAATADRYAQHEKGRHAVGLWHTHPEARPSPSRRDRVTTEEYLKGFRGMRERYLLVIVGNAGATPAMAVWAAEGGGWQPWVEEATVPRAASSAGFGAG